MRTKPQSGSSGFTLIEILITLAIVVMIMGLAVSKMGDSFESQAYDAAKQLASTVRFLFNKAASENLTMLIEFNFEKQSYVVKATADTYRLESEDAKKERQQKKKDALVALPQPDKGSTESDAKAPASEGEAGFSAVDSYLLDPVTLPTRVLLKDVFTEHDNGPVSQGTASIYIFPNGYVERSIINFKNEDDTEHVAVEINPMTGAAKILDEYKELKK